MASLVCSGVIEHCSSLLMATGLPEGIITQHTLCADCVYVLRHHVIRCSSHITIGCSMRSRLRAAVIAGGRADSSMRCEVACVSGCKADRTACIQAGEACQWMEGGRGERDERSLLCWFTCCSVTLISAVSAVTPCRDSNCRLSDSDST